MATYMWILGLAARKLNRNFWKQTRHFLFIKLITAHHFFSLGFATLSEGRYLPNHHWIGDEKVLRMRLSSKMTVKLNMCWKKVLKFGIFRVPLKKSFKGLYHLSPLREKLSWLVNSFNVFRILNNLGGKSCKQSKNIRPNQLSLVKPKYDDLFYEYSFFMNIQLIQL
jgi:hypothetical protein